MKVSISLPDDDVRFLDEYASWAGTESRSAVVHEAIGLLRSASLEEAYAAAWDESDAGEGAMWEGTAADGIADAAR